jgi:hypothetical protein
MCSDPGTALGFIGYAWLTALAFRQGAAWGFVLILFFPLAGIVYIGADTKRKLIPLFLIYAGAIFSCAGMAFLNF